MLYFCSWYSSTRRLRSTF